LKEKYKGSEAENIMVLMHFFSEEDRRKPVLYETLIDYLGHSNLVVRELASLHLKTMVPHLNIPYFADADIQTREKAQAAWRTVIPPGQLPPAVTPPAKKKGA